MDYLLQMMEHGLLLVALVLDLNSKLCQIQVIQNTFRALGLMAKMYDSYELAQAQC